MHGGGNWIYGRHVIIYTTVCLQNAKSLTISEDFVVKDKDLWSVLTDGISRHYRQHSDEWTETFQKYCVAFRFLRLLSPVHTARPDSTRLN